MGAAFTGGPYIQQDFTAGTEDILVETMGDIFTAASWALVEKVQAWASNTSTSTNPTNGTTIIVDLQVYTFKAVPIHTLDVQIGPSAAATLNNLAIAVNGHSPHVTITIDGDTGIATARWDAGGSSGNGKNMSGWPGWASDPTYGAPLNSLWLGGYKFRTNFPGTSVLLPAIPCICYVFQAANFDWAWLIDAGGGWPATGVGFQFMSQDQSKKGLVHLITSGPGASLRVIASPTHFFMRRTNAIGDSSGAVICGGSYYVNYDRDDPPSNAWWSMGDWNGNPFGAQPTLRVGYSDLEGFMSMNELCYGDGVYVVNGDDNHRWNMIPSLRMTPDNPAIFHSAAQVATKYGGDPFVCDPMLLSGDRLSSGYRKYRGQIYDALTVCASFPTGYTGESLAAAYPWADGSTLSDGVTPRNRLSPDFDLAKWENFTEMFQFGSLFLVKGKPAITTGFNYVYEGKA